MTSKSQEKRLAIQDPDQKRSGVLKWRHVYDDPPKDEQDCLVKTKHGIMSGEYDAEDHIFHTYVGTDLTFYGREWVPIEEAQ